MTTVASPYEVQCPYCGEMLTLVRSDEISPIDPSVGSIMDFSDPLNSGLIILLED